MSFAQVIVLLCLFLQFGLTARIPNAVRQDLSGVPSSDEAPEPNICGEIIDLVNQGSVIFYASDAYLCLTSVPFNDAVALRFIDYYNTTMQFQSTLAYLKDPPEGYQQPSVDFFGSLQEIKNNVTSGYYKNQYAFEADLQHLIYSMHDRHVSLSAGILSAFSFGSPYALVSASPDGKQAPQVYIQDDILVSRQEGWDPSPIVSINGEDVVEYLTKFAALNSVGMVEPHADWTQLMSGPAQDIQGYFNTFTGAATFYPGDELIFEFANGTSLDTWWLALYNTLEYTGPLTTGGDFYNYFVLGFIPASYDPNNVPDVFRPNPSPYNFTVPQTSNWNGASSGAYPNDPIAVQRDLSVEGGGVVTGYFLDDNTTGVLSIPTFNQVGWDVANFSDTIDTFISDAQDAGISRVIIDLQQNYGGQAELAFVTFKQFFPPSVPFAGSRRRSHELANILGGATTSFWDSLSLQDESEVALRYQEVANEWVITPRLNAETGRNFTSWSEYFGPRNYQGDDFSLTERYDLANEIFDQAAFDGWIPNAYTEDGRNLTLRPAPWQPENIVILTDGICSSACSLFLEMMTHDAGVRTVTVGGRPTTGPMQAASGNRGARYYSAENLDSAFTFASDNNATAAAALPDRSVRGIYTNYAGFNLRDQVRANESEPLQFKYLAADCRIYYTLANIYDMSRLWQDTANAMWEDASLCVQDSTGYAASANGTTPKPPPQNTVQVSDFSVLEYGVDFNTEQTGGLPDFEALAGRGSSTQLCTPGYGACGASKACQQVSVTCSNRDVTYPFVCVSLCGNRLGCAAADQYCRFTGYVQGSTQSTSGTSRRTPRANITPPWEGVCVPSYGTAALGCPI